MRGLIVLIAVAAVFSAPVNDQPAALSNMDLSLTVFDQHSARSADQSKNFVIFAFDNEACTGDHVQLCADLQDALNKAKDMTGSENSFSKYREHVQFGKANKDDFPDHKADFEKAKITLPAVLFWPAGHTRPSCKFDAEHAKGEQLYTWLLGKIKEEDDDDLIELEEGAALAALVDPAVLVCQADGGPNVLSPPLSCSDAASSSPEELSQGLMQLSKTQQMWDAKTKSMQFVGPADNSLSHEVKGGVAVPVRDISSAGYHETAAQNLYQALYVYAPWCSHCGCLDPIWDDVAAHLVGGGRQPELVVAKVNGDANPELRQALKVSVYPSFVVVSKDGSTILGQSSGPRKVFDLANWVKDLIVADQNPIVKHVFAAEDQPAVSELGPVHPYEGDAAWPSL